MIRDVKVYQFLFSHHWPGNVQRRLLTGSLAFKWEHFCPSDSQSVFVLLYGNSSLFENKKRKIYDTMFPVKGRQLLVRSADLSFGNELTLKLFDTCLQFVQKFIEICIPKIFGTSIAEKYFSQQNKPCEAGVRGKFCPGKLKCSRRGHLHWPNLF